MLVFLPNKEMDTQEKLFRMIISIIPGPKSPNCDFEKAIHMAALKVFVGCIIYGCFFMCQNWLPPASLKSCLCSLQIRLLKKTFKLSQALAYLPAHHVVEGFVIIENHRPI